MLGIWEAPQQQISHLIGGRRLRHRDTRQFVARLYHLAPGRTTLAKSLSTWCV